MDAERMRRDAETLLELVRRGEMMYDLLGEITARETAGAYPFDHDLKDRTFVATQLWRKTAGPKELR